MMIIGVECFKIIFVTHCQNFLICVRSDRNLSFPNSVIGRHRSSVIGRRRLRTSDDNDLEHVMNTENSLETCPVASFRSPPTFYNLYKLFFYINL